MFVRNVPITLERFEDRRFEVYVLGIWVPIERSEINQRLRSGDVIHWNPRIEAVI